MGVPLHEFDVLELFGRDGTGHVQDYAKFVGSLEVWEIDREWRPKLECNIPGARIKITDSFQEVRTTPTTYDLLVVDAPLAVTGTYCEHFDLFPHLFRICRERSVLILNVIPSATSGDLKWWPNVFSPAHLARRREFYGSITPEQIALPEMARRYARLADENGFDCDWHFFQQRPGIMVYFVCHLTRRPGSPDDPPEDRATRGSAADVSGSERV